MTQRELERLCGKWQKKLRLTDWRVTPRLVTGIKDYGSCSIDRSLRLATILVRDLRATPPGSLPEDATDAGIETDEEETLVHELCHIHTDSFEPDADDPRNADHEFFLNALSEALVALDRGS